MNVKINVQDMQRLQNALNHINVKLKAEAIAKVNEDGELVLQKLQGHIQSQDLGWNPKKMYGTRKWWVETGELSNGMEALHIGEKGNSYGVFIGFLANKSHHSGMSMAELASQVYLEGKHPLVGPTWAELQGKLLGSWKTFIIDFMRGC